jgi:hypothetical protein
MQCAHFERSTGRRETFPPPLPRLPIFRFESVAATRICLPIIELPWRESASLRRCRLPGGSLEESRDSRCEAVSILQLAFPYCQHPPPVAAKPLKIAPVAHDIAKPFLLPIRRVGLGRDAGVLTGVHVPEASVDVDDLAKLGKYEIGSADDVTAMEAEPISEAMHQPAYNHFRPGVTRFNRRHDSRTLDLGKLFRHVPILGALLSMRRIVTIMSDSELQALKADFLEWTGGFEPETEDDIAVYVETAMAFDSNPLEVREALREWMREAATSN